MKFKDCIQTFKPTPAGAGGCCVALAHLADIAIVVFGSVHGGFLQVIEATRP